MRDVRFREDMRVAHRLQTEKRVAANRYVLLVRFG
jgi:hypothetical protein